MKLLSSSFSSPSSSSSAASFDVNNVCSLKSATAGCLAGILRRILCSGTLPTHPSDHIMEETNSAKSCCRDLKTGEEKILSLETTPGLVARLMGLESMPDVDFGGIKSRPNSVSRSRSINAMDQFAAGYYCDDLKQQLQGQHRRAKSTTGTKPEFVELRNEEFFILSFENVSASREFRLKERKCEAGYGELRQRRTGRVKKAENRMEKAATTTTITTKKKKDDGEGNTTVLSNLNGKETLKRSCSDKRTNKDGNNVKVKDSKTKTSSAPTKVKVVVVSSEAVKSPKDKKCDKVLPNLNKKKNTKRTNSQTVKRVEPDEFTSEDSSPVSVLECGQFLSDPQIPISEEDCGSTTTSSRRKLSLQIENYDRLCPRRDDNFMSDEGKHVGLSREKERDIGQECYYSQVLDKICRLSETELFGSSNWVRKWTLNHEDFQGIGEELESQIFGQLLKEFLEQS